jgi:16S rRNA (guanine527-N7)-methyltransferase
VRVFTEILRGGLEELNLVFSASQIEQCVLYASLLQEWNKRINLTSIVQEQEMARKHFLDSLQGGLYLNWQGVSCLLDLGSGAGFPGLVLKIWRPELELILVDAVQKKVHFLQEVIQQLKLQNVAAVHSRAEDLGRNRAWREKHDAVVARAVASLNVLVEYGLPLVRRGGFFYAYKGPDCREEIQEARTAISLLGGKLREVYRYSLPVGKERRTLVVVEKINNTPSIYPRRSGIPEKRPLK